MYCISYIHILYHIHMHYITQGQEYGRWGVGLVLYSLSFLTTLGNGLVLHAIRTERRLQTVGLLRYVLYCRLVLHAIRTERRLQTVGLL